MSAREDDTADAVRGHVAMIAAARQQAERFRLGSSSGGPGPGALEGAIHWQELRKYSLIREIHRGGQGVVYLAEQSTPRRQVAVKMVREGPLASAGDQLRFQREIELLGSLSHPNIVSIHDSGKEGGLLYFVMDFVEGPTLDDYVRPLREQAAASRSRKDILRFHREALRLFAKICDAVQAAQLRGIIHRDLKPSNIRIDARAEPRVLDFGLAKDASGSHLAADGPSLTEAGQFLGTLAYASPEQADGAIVGLDLRTDVYSLGVILYRLLTGRSPYDATESVSSLIDAILHQDPVRPSSIVPELAGDIETILMTALQKPRERRYQTAGALAADIRHFLAAEPIDAKRDSTWYVVRKQLMRHRVLLTAGIAICLVVAIGSVVSLALWRGSVRQRERAQLESDKSQAINEFLRDMLASASPYRRPGEAAKVRDILHDAQLRLDAGAFSEQPEVEAGLRDTLGMSYLALGHTQSAIELLSRALDIRESALAPNHVDLAASHLNLGHAYFESGNYDDAERQLETARAILESVDSPQSVSRDVAEVDYWLGRIAQNRGRTTDAAQRIERAMESLGASGEPRLRASCVEALSVVEGQFGHAKKSLALARRAVAIRRESPGEHPDLIASLTRLGAALVNNGDYEESAKVDAEATSLARKLLGRHPVLGDCLTREASILIRLGRYEEALERCDECIPILRESLGEDHIRTTAMMSLKANALKKLGRFDESASIQLESITINRRHNRRLNVAGGLLNYAQCMQQLHHLDDAESSLHEAVDIFREIRMGDKPIPALAVALTNLASVVLEQGRPSDAEDIANEALDLTSQSSQSTGTELASTKMILAQCLAAREAWANAESLLLDGIEDIDQVPAPPAQRVAYRRRLLRQLADLYRRWDDAAPDVDHEEELTHVEAQLAELDAPSKPTAPK